MGLCVQRALVGSDQPATALCTIVPITDNLLGCNFAGCNPQEYSHESVRNGVLDSGYFVS